MEIKITIDDRLVDLIKRLLTPRKVGVTVVLATLLLGGTVFALDPTPVNTFQNGQTLSATALNRNFSDVYGAVAALETLHSELSADISAMQSQLSDLQSDVSGLQGDVGDSANPLSTCTMHETICYPSEANPYCDAECPTGTHPVFGSCSIYLSETYSYWGIPMDEEGSVSEEEVRLSDLTGWRCYGTDSELRAYAVCCDISG